MTTTALFALDELWLERPGDGGAVRTILGGITAQIGRRDTITCLTGPSGSGKSTLLRLLNRLEDPTRGRILFGGEDVATLDPLALRRRVGLVLQTPVMLPGTVRENLAAGLRLRGLSLADPAGWMSRVGLPAGLLDRPAAELSGGEKQRVALARTLVNGPEVLLLDEVTSSLDADSAAGIETLILGLGLPAIWVSHDPAQVKRVAARVIRLHDGQLFADEPEREVTECPPSP